jgi:hypothetical protein
MVNVLMAVPPWAYMGQISNIQRGIIFIWFFTVFVITIITLIRILSGQIEYVHSTPNNKYLADNIPTSAIVSNQSLSNENYHQQVYRSQVVTDIDTGYDKLGKKIDRLNTILMPVMVTFVLNFILGVSYVFCFVLYFVVFVFILLFNLLEIHKSLFHNKILICICENLWLIATFFWILNIWLTQKFLQPYDMY